MIDPELLPFLAMWDKAWSVLPPNATPPQRRALIEKLAAELRPPMPPEIDDATEHVPWRDMPVRVRIHRYKGAGVAPCLIYLHGGAWMQGSPETHEDATVEIARQTRHTVISVDYALAPEHPFPIALRQCEAVVAWAHAEAARLGIRADAISVGGDSAGGNLAAALTLLFRGSPVRLKGQVLFYPAVDVSHSRPSFRENADGPIIKTANMAATMAAYCPDPAQLRTPLVAPLLAPDHAGLPPAFIAVAEHDPLRDDGLAYAEALSAAGVPVTLERGAGLIHGYLRAMSYCRAARAGLDAACAWLIRLNANEQVA
ncbi:alpha/beta hydrolase [Desertibaculum subflavum]|uniref:alpha/beta hydrolase n=1 Tax=Desertibaculum subflavum TaxID=2268458 RepID=UPI000E669A9A